jgi:hypothetical protein
MCPLCLSALGWIAAGGVSAAGFGALLVRRHGKGNCHGDDRCDDPSDGDA